MNSPFESQKNIKAGSYTALVLALLLVVFIFVTWTTPPIPVPPIEEGIEVNLGNSDQGLGEDQPMSPDAPAPATVPDYTPPVSNTTEEEAVKDVETDDSEPDAPAVKKPVITKPDATKVADKDIVKSKPVTNPTPVVTPLPSPPKPKAVMKGVNGNGAGGNEADDYKKGGNQGIAGGTGDQGKPGGNPNSNNYEGNGGRGSAGISISKGLAGRTISRFPSFEDEFNENAKVAVDIKLDASGNVTSASFQPRGSTTSDAGMKAIAIRKARQLKFNAGNDDSAGTIIFNFKLKN